MCEILPDEVPDEASQRERLRARIREVFEGVVLGDGVGLYQAQGIDDNEHDEVCQSFRQKDEKDDSCRIKLESLNQCYSSLSFFDAEGMRFHLPAYLLAEINGDYKFGLLEDFINLGDHQMRMFSLLTAGQRGAVGDYLGFIQDQPGYWLQVHEIDHALESFWNIEQTNET